MIKYAPDWFGVQVKAVYQGIDRNINIHKSRFMEFRVQLVQSGHE